MRECRKLKFKNYYSAKKRAKIMSEKTGNRMGVHICLKCDRKYYHIFTIKEK